MNVTHTLPKRGWRWLRPSPASIVAFGLVLLFVALTSLHYRFHLLWLSEARRLQLQNVQAVPDVPMPDSPMPENWVPCRVGEIELSLPPELAAKRIEKRGMGGPYVTFLDETRGVVIESPTNASDVADLLTIATKLSPQPERFTVPRLRLACYRASSDDFRWSMTPAEARWHAYCMATGRLLRLSSVTQTESLLGQHLDRVLLFSDDRADLEWQTNDGAWGTLHFIDRGKKLDPTWMRAVCQSLRVSNEVDTEQRTSKPNLHSSAD